jgi:hypothetical protein
MALCSEECLIVQRANGFAAQFAIRKEKERRRGEEEVSDQDGEWEW